MNPPDSIPSNIVNPIRWITQLRPTAGVLKATMALVILELLLNWLAEPFFWPIFDAIEGVQAGSFAKGILSVPFWLFRLTQFLIILFLIASWKAIWNQVFGFTKLNWYYVSLFYVRLVFTAYFLVVAVICILNLTQLGDSLNELHIALRDLTDTLFDYAFYVVLVQIAAFKHDLFGLKSWFIITGAASSLLVLTPVPLSTFSTLSFAVVQILLILRILKASTPAVEIPPKLSAAP